MRVGREKVKDYGGKLQGKRQGRNKKVKGREEEGEKIKGADYAEGEKHEG